MSIKRIRRKLKKVSEKVELTVNGDKTKYIKISQGIGNRAHEECIKVKEQC